MYTLDLAKSEEPDIKLPIPLETQKKQGNSRKTSIFASLSALKTLIVWITTSQKNSWKFLETGIQDHHICPLRNLYTGQQATVRNINRTRDHFKTGKRVCQGNKLSPCLFNIGAGYIILYSGWSTTWTQDSVQLSSVPQSTIRVGAPTLWDPTHGSTPGFPINNCRSLFKCMSIKSGMPSNHFILSHPLLLLPSIIPSIRVFSNDSGLCISWPKYCSFSFSISPSNEYSGLIFFRLTGLISLQSKGLSRVFKTTVQKHQFFGTQPSLWSNFHIHTWLLEKP